MRLSFTFAPYIVFGAFGFSFLTIPALSMPPSEGQRVPDFSLPSAEGTQVRLSEVWAQAPVALVILRGYPGYQCPMCTRQVQDFVKNAGEFRTLGVRVVFVYPGPAANVGAKANEFLAEKPLPAGFHMVLDKDYAVTNEYDVRWNEPKETAYPSTFLLDSNGVVILAKVSKTHGGRTSAQEVLERFRQRKTSR